MKQEELKPIIDLITSEVMKKVNDYLDTNHSDRIEDVPPESEKENMLLVFTGGPANLDEVTRQLKILGRGHHFLAMFSSAGEKAIGRARVREDIDFEEVEEEDLYTALGKTQKIVFPTLTQNTAVKGALGIRDTAASEAMACGILLKKCVVAVSDAIPIRSMPAAYGRMVGEHLKRLEQLGVALCKADELSGCFFVEKVEDESVYPELEPNTNPADSVDTVPPGAFVYEERAPITSETIFKLVREGYDKLILPPRTLVTPMARDTAKEKNITLEWAVK